LRMFFIRLSKWRDKGFRRPEKRMVFSGSLKE